MSFFSSWIAEHVSLKKNRERITGAWLNQREELEQVDNQLRELNVKQRADRILLRQRFRSGQMSQRDYQAALGTRRTEISELKRLKSQTENVLCKLIPEIPIDEWKQVLALLQLKDDRNKRR